MYELIHQYLRREDGWYVFKNISIFKKIKIN